MRSMTAGVGDAPAPLVDVAEAAAESAPPQARPRRVDVAHAHAGLLGLAWMAAAARLPRRPGGKPPRGLAVRR